MRTTAPLPNLEKRCRLAVRWAPALFALLAAAPVLGQTSTPPMPNLSRPRVPDIKVGYGTKKSVSLKGERATDTPPPETKSAEPSGTAPAPTPEAEPTEPAEPAEPTEPPPAPVSGPSAPPPVAAEPAPAAPPPATPPAAPPTATPPTAAPPAAPAPVPAAEAIPPEAAKGPVAPPIAEANVDQPPANPEEGAAAGMPAGDSARSGGLLERVARRLFGGKEGEVAATGTEEDAGNAESRETQRKAKELMELAIRNIEKKRVSEAKKNLNDLITLKPYEADYHLALGLCFRQEKRYKEAQKKYQDVLDLGGPRSLVNLLMSEVAAQAGDKEKVFEYLKEAAVGGRNIFHDVQNLPLLDKYKGDTEFIKLALSLEKFELASKKTQDPFTNPFPTAQAQGAPRTQANPNAPVTLSVQEQTSLLADARRYYEKVLWYIKLEDENRAMENYHKLREQIEKKDLLTVPKIVNDFRILMSRMDELEIQIEGIRLKYYWNNAQARLKSLKEAFQSAEYARVDTLYAEVEKLSKEMEKANARFKPVADRILSAGRGWLNRANVRREFQARKPEIQGVVIASEAKLAIIDNRIFKQGESFGEFHIQNVENNRVTFRYKGEEIPLVFRRY